MALTRITEPVGGLADGRTCRVTMTGLVPPLARLWTETAEAGTDFDLSTLDTVLVGGARCPDELARRIGPALGVTLQQVFGMAEGLVCYTRLDDPEEVITSTQGRRCPRRRAPAGHRGREIVTDGPGFLETQGPYTILRLLGRPQSQSFAPDGWYRTGDVVELTAEGNMLVRGRGGDRVNRAARRCRPNNSRRSCSHIRRSATRSSSPSPTSSLGERTCAYVIAVDPEQPPTLPVLRKSSARQGWPNGSCRRGQGDRGVPGDRGGQGQS